MKWFGIDLDKLFADKQIQEVCRITLPFIILILGGVFFILIYALQFALRDFAIFLSALSVAIVVAGAALLIGGLIGFLFGIPRTLTQDFIEAPRNGSNGPTANAANRNRIQANTNLEQISDWLTKILVGVGLTQIPGILAAVDRLIEKVAPGLGSQSPLHGPVRESFALALLVYFSVCGFFLGFLWARLYLLRQFREVEVAALQQEVKRIREVDVSQMRQEVKQVGDQLKIDGNAQILANRQLSARFPETKREELQDAIQKASQATRKNIFIEAQQVRSANWHHNPALMERTIPVFEALIASEPEYHRYYAELGFAIKDMRQPDFQRAENLLTKAIDLREDWHKHGGWTTYYEFNRAICHIQLDPNFRQQQPSQRSRREAIWQDLRQAAAGGVLSQPQDEKITQTVIQSWLAVNNLAPQTLFEPQPA